MLIHLLRPGDIVRMAARHPASSFKKRADNGVLGTVVGRERVSDIVIPRYPPHPVRAPGIYSMDGGLIVTWEEYPQENVETENSDYSRPDSSDLEPADCFRREWLQRLKEEWPVRLEDGSSNLDFNISAAADQFDHVEKTGDLPETPIWELDIVEYEGRRHRVTHIHYFAWGSERDHAYGIEQIYDNNEYARMGSTSAPLDQLTLIERGNVWREANNEPLVFKSLDEEMRYAINMGRAKEVCNPETKNFFWPSVTELQKAVEDDLVDGFSAKLTGNYIARRYQDRDLGERVRQTTLITLNTMKKHFLQSAE